MSKSTKTEPLKYLRDHRKRLQGYRNDLANLDIKIREDERRTNLMIKKLEKVNKL